MKRRSFIELVGASAAFAGGIATAVCEWTPFEGGTTSSKRDKPVQTSFEEVSTRMYTREGQPGAYTTYSRLDSMEEFEVTPSVVGTREMGTMTRLVGYEDMMVSSRTFQPVGPPFTYGFLESAPNKIPVLKVMCVLDSTRGDTLDVRVGTEAVGVDEPLMRFGTGHGTNTNHQYDEVYLNEVGEGTAPRKPRTISDGTVRVWARVSGGSGRIRADSTLYIDWEVI